MCLGPRGYIPPQIKITLQAVLSISLIAHAYAATSPLLQPPNVSNPSALAAFSWTSLACQPFFFCQKNCEETLYNIIDTTNSNCKYRALNLGEWKDISPFPSLGYAWHANCCHTNLGCLAPIASPYFVLIDYEGSCGGFMNLEM